MPLRRIPLAAVTVITVAALTGCSPAEPAPSVPTWQPPTPVPSTSAGPDTDGPATATPAPAKLSGPLTPADLGRRLWTSAESPSVESADWVDACGTGTGVADIQDTARMSVLTGPGGVEVLTRVATYKAEGALTALHATEDLFTSCVNDETGRGERVSRLVTAPADLETVGVQQTTYDEDAEVSDMVGYWITRVGDATVEVYARATFLPTGPTDPMEAFSGDLRDAAVAKALGEPVAALSVPLVASLAPSAGDGVADGAGEGTGRGAAPTLPAPGVGGPAGPGGGLSYIPEPPAGVGGETGPGDIVGQGAAERLP